MDSKEELVDIISKDDSIIGHATKQEAHEKGLLHRTIIAEVINSQGQILLVQQASYKQEPGLWVSPMGGHITSGESEIEALNRETFEELGIRNFIHTFKGRIIVKLRVRNQIQNHLFIVYELLTDEKPVLSNEATHYKRFIKDELKKELRDNPSQFGKAYHPIVKKFYPEFLEF